MGQSPRQYNEFVICSIARSCALDAATGKAKRANALFSEFMRLYALCESPIETEIASLLAAYSVYCGYCVSAQEQVPGVGRVDFCMRHETLRMPIAIECDGHDFHERTKDQARRDRKRDRDLQAKGFFVCRLTGHEIVSKREETLAAVTAIITSLAAKAA